jgi:hypothetical protein
MEHSNINRDNLANRERLERVRANTGLGFNSSEANTLAEALCHTEAVPEDLLYANTEGRIRTMFQAGYIEKVGGGNPALYQPKRNDRWKLTDKGSEAIDRAVQAPYTPVNEMISHTEDGGGEADRIYKEILGEEVKEVRKKSWLERLI